MATNHERESGEDRNPSVEFDKTDLSARGILIFFIVLAVFAVVLNLIVIGLYAGMTKIAEKHDPDLGPLVPKAVTPRAGILTNTANVNIQKFPEPRLQNDDTSDMTRFLAKEAEALTTQPWQDAQGNVHLPIGQAMKAVEIRLPVRAGAAPLPNYPGAGAQYSHPTAPAADAALPQNESAAGEAGNTPAAR
jgi:hypothetical protein